MFRLSVVPRQLICPRCGEYIKDIDLAEGFEVLVADLLQARNMYYRQRGYDVCDSSFFPGLTFQVKYSNPKEHEEVTKAIKGRNMATWKQRPTWSWSEPHALGASWYILFGISGNDVYPFAVPVWIWEKESYDMGNGGRILTISTKKKSRCGRHSRSYKRNKFWKHYLKRWPEDLYSRIRHHEKLGNVGQLGFSL